MEILLAFLEPVICILGAYIFVTVFRPDSSKFKLFILKLGTLILFLSLSLAVLSVGLIKIFLEWLSVDLDRNEVIIILIVLTNLFFITITILFNKTANVFVDHPELIDEFLQNDNETNKVSLVYNRFLLEFVKYKQDHRSRESTAAEPTLKDTPAASGEESEEKRFGILTWGLAALLVLLSLGGGGYWWVIRPRMATEKLYKSILMAPEVTTAEVQALLDAGANAKKYDIFYYAACCKEPGVVKALLAAGLDVNTTVKYINETALMKAAQCNNTEMMRVLLTAGADVNAKDSNGRTALYRVTDPERVELLLAAGADVNSKNKEGMTVLMQKAAWNKNPDMVKALLAAGAEVDAVDVNDWTALMYAVGANPDKRRCVTYSSDTDCNWETGNPNPEVVKMLLQAGANVNAKDKAGKTALMHAAWWNHDPEVVVKMLLDAGADVHAVNEEGMSALMYALDRKENETLFRYRKEDNRAEKAEAVIQLLQQSSQPQQQNGSQRRGRKRRR